MKIIAIILFVVAVAALFANPGEITTAQASQDPEFAKGAAYGKYIAAALLAGVGALCWRKGTRKA